VAGAEIERDRHDVVRRHGLMAQPLGGPVAQAPGAAVALDERRKRPCPARPEHAGDHRPVALAEEFAILPAEVMRPCFEDCGGHASHPLRVPFDTRARRRPPQPWWRNCCKLRAAQCQAYASSRAATSFAIANAPRAPIRKIKKYFLDNRWLS